MAQSEGVYVFPEAMAKASGIDPNLLLALQNGGGFGGNGNWIWILFLWFIYGNNGWGGNGFGGNNGTGYLANQISNSEGRDLLLQAINGRADAAAQLASITNTSVETVKNGIFSLQSSINQVGNQVGMSGMQTINAIQAGLKLPRIRLLHSFRWLRLRVQTSWQYVSRLMLCLHKQKGILTVF